MPTGHRPDAGWAWVVMLSSFGAHTVNGFYLFSLGILNVAFLERFNEDVGTTSWASGLFLGLFSFGGFLSGIIVNKLSCRVSMMIGSLLMTSGLVITAFVNNIYFVIVSFGLISGLGAGLTLSSSVVVLGFNFERNRNLASGMAVSGCGVGVFALTPLMQMAKETYGYSGLCLMCAALSFHHLLFGALFRPSSLEIKSKHLKKLSTRKSDNDRKHKFAYVVQMIDVMRNFGFTCFCFSLMLYSIGSFPLYVHFPSLVLEEGTSEKGAAYLLSISGICNAVARLLVGLAANSENINELLLYSGTFSVLGLFSVLFPLYSKFYVGQLVFAIVLGIYSGCCYTLLNTLTVKLVGIHQLPTAFGILMVWAGFGSVIGPPFAGILVDAGGTFSQSFMVAGVIVLLGGALGWSVSCCDNGKASRTDGHKVEQTIVVEKDTSEMNMNGKLESESLFEDTNS
ncbi:hypothetical protein FSP39_007527 [Pinctada imbricata]|uniref:Major facilitator superfamily (MFS) profile domain-containing protein n=1 Tax=Pinctada imbricata TaxID=66713 RepID=A0AA88YN74_PINIB|nr:hypothetical protein FSP39_007527 [Pinctada imbricata]